MPVRILHKLCEARLLTEIDLRLEDSVVSRLVIHEFENQFPILLTIFVNCALSPMFNRD